MPQLPFNAPPSTGNAAFDEYAKKLHNLIFGFSGSGGTLDDENVDVDVLQSHEIDGAFHNSTSPLSEAKGGTGQITFVAAHAALAGNHGDMVEGTAIADVNNSTASVTELDADATYGTAERDLINEIKSDFNILVTDVNDLIAQFNGLLSSLEIANVINT